MGSILFIFVSPPLSLLTQDKSDGSTQWDPEVEEQVWNSI